MAHYKLGELAFLHGLFEQTHTAGYGRERATRYDGRYLHHYETDSGMVRIEAQLPPEEAAVVLLAIEQARNELAEDGAGAAVCDGDATLTSDAADAPQPGTRNDVSAGTASTTPADAIQPASARTPARPRATLVDGLVRLAEGVVRSANLFVHLKDDPLHPQRLHAQLEDGTRLPTSALRRLCCDQNLVPVQFDGRGGVLDIGRKTRLIPPAIARALQVRDGGVCRFPG